MGDAGKIQVLIVTGLVTIEHDLRTVPMLRRMLESTGRFDVRVTEEFRGGNAETLAAYDLVLLYYEGRLRHDSSEFTGLGETAERSLLDFVRAGGGLVSYHSTVISYPIEDRHRLMGARFDGGRKSPTIEFRVDIADARHPITEGLDPSWLVVQDDFFVPSSWGQDSPVEVLATVREGPENYERMPAHIAPMYPPERVAALPNMDVDVPVAWTNRYGDGRVLVVSIGHGPDTIRRPNFVALLCRGAEWAATGEVTIAPPDLKNERRRRAWPYYSDADVSELLAITTV